MNGCVTRDQIIVALDVDAHEALRLARQLEGRVRWLKVGMTLYYAEGPEIVRRLRSMGFDVFVDLKLHDIPHQVAGAARELARLGAGMLTVHAAGGEAMMRAAVEASGESAGAAGLTSPAILAVTVLTSMDDETLHSIGVPRSPADQVENLVRLARRAGVDGVVCSPQEASAVRSELGPNALVVTPGVRPEGSEVGDQARVATPAQAVAAGASHLVIGRPITGSALPAEAVERIVEGT
ncbi:MAG: orotidine-5'-phosphate decarboxylase [Coriobacteriales bacterium]|nr:orotidine-5'-phosphate decarboxylase [Coriobacteriales bacterium]